MRVAARESEHEPKFKYGDFADTQRCEAFPRTPETEYSIVVAFGVLEHILLSEK